MSPLTQEHTWVRRSKWLTQALIISGALNIGFLATFAYFALKDKQKTLVLELKPSPKELAGQDATPTNVQLLRSYSVLPYQELILRLENKQPAEEGLSKRDLALACLVTFHHFNLDKALGGLPIQKKSVAFTNQEGQETIQLSVFPGLADYQFLAIQQYAKTEKWPLTDQGLFYELKRSREIREPSLLAAFYLSPEYYAAHTLLTKSGLNLTKEEVLDLLIEGDWSLLTELNTRQRVTLDLSIENRLSFLLGHLKYRSQRAAQLLIEHDLPLVAKRCDDKEVLTLLDLHPEHTPALEQFAKELLLSPRTEAVCRRAAFLLYAWAKEEWKEPYNHLAVLQRFCPQAVAPTPALAPQTEPLVMPVKATLQPHKPTVPSIQTVKKKRHTIEPGDNLWKIARKYRVSVEEIMRANHMQTEKLRAGKQIEIPEKKPVAK